MLAERGSVAGNGAILVLLYKTNYFLLLSRWYPYIQLTFLYEIQIFQKQNLIIRLWLDFPSKQRFLIFHYSKELLSDSNNFLFALTAVTNINFSLHISIADQILSTCIPTYWFFQSASVFYIVEESTQVRYSLVIAVASTNKVLEMLFSFLC